MKDVSFPTMGVDGERFRDAVLCAADVQSVGMGERLTCRDEGECVCCLLCSPDSESPSMSC